MVSKGKGNARKPTVKVVNHAPPTDQVVLRDLRVKQADAAVASAESSVARAKEHIAIAETKDKKERQRDHLKVAEDALAQAIAARKELG